MIAIKATFIRVKFGRAEFEASDRLFQIPVTLEQGRALALRGVGRSFDVAATLGSVTEVIA